MIYRRNPGTAGFSLLEVLIGMIIFAFGILGAIPLLMAAMSSNSSSRDFAIAGRLAKEKLEFYQETATITGTPISDTESGLEGGFSRQTFVFDNTTDTTLADGIYKVDVIVTWSDDTGVERASQYTTMVRKDGA